MEGPRGSGTNSPPAVPAPPLSQGRLTGGPPLEGEVFEQFAEMCAETPERAGWEQAARVQACVTTCPTVADLRL
ncbi:hypothetical protein GCM10010307_26230 [Streptomyces vastus]|uniref:4Fe-4S Wbl-type domain-containing protein n=1 Tax=Streptomyces vastus TaxID=285451 RepID=A0ABN3QQG1_9ACTN